MVWSQTVEDRSQASKLERKIKHMTKLQKEELITKK
jgi:predicted GIY-YIG superfamily endonuclease